jgi:catalase
MPQPGTKPAQLPILALAIAAFIFAVVAIGFAFTAGWLSPQRLTPGKMLKALAPPGGPVPGYRRNHAKGICFTGTFTANGEATALSIAQVFAPGQYPVVGRFNLAGGDPHAPDAMAAVRGFSTRILGPNSQEWRSAMIDAPVFAAPTPQAFYQFLTASASKDPNAFKQYAAAHPEILKFVGWAKGHPRHESFAEDRFNSLNSFLFVDAAGTRHAVRWSFVPSEPPVVVTPEELAKRGPDFLEQEITQRVAAGPLHWDLVVTVANFGDPTSDPTKAWPEDRKTVHAGSLTVQNIEPEADGPCRDINYDPTVLPAGITTSDDPFPAARSAAYRASFDHRIAEASQYPHSTSGARQ